MGDLWDAIFAARLQAYPLGRVLLINYPGEGRGYPSIRDEVRVLQHHAKLGGVIVARLDKAALRRFAYDSDEDVEQYLASLERRVQKLGELDMLSSTKQLWTSEMYVEDGTSLASSAGRASLAVRDRLQM